MVRGARSGDSLRAPRQDSRPTSRESRGTWSTQCMTATLKTHVIRRHWWGEGSHVERGKPPETSVHVAILLVVGTCGSSRTIRPTELTFSWYVEHEVDGYCGNARSPLSPDRGQSRPAAAPRARGRPWTYPGLPSASAAAATGDRSRSGAVE